MVRVSAGLALPNDDLTLFYTTDDLLSDSPILICYGLAVATAGFPTSNSCIQSHVITPVGFQSYPRLAISPASPLYSAVHHLPREEQGDEVCRALAFSLFKYFSDLPETVKNQWIQKSVPTVQPLSVSKLFTEWHAGRLVSHMVKIDNARDILNDLKYAFGSHSVSCLDVDIILPSGAIRKAGDDSDVEPGFSGQEDELRYGPYAPLVSLFGETVFMPTTRIRRAPSRPTAVNRSIMFLKTQKENLRREMCELLATEDNYVNKLHDLVDVMVHDVRTIAQSQPADMARKIHTALSNLFPSSLDEILNLNERFYRAMQIIVEQSTTSASQDISSSVDGASSQDIESLDQANDPLGLIGLAHCVLEWFPTFERCYGEYICAHAEFAQHLRIVMTYSTSSVAQRIRDFGEQRLMSMLIEPVQRLPRYSLFVDNITKQLPLRHAALPPLLKAKDIISNICAQDRHSAQHSKILERLQALIPSWPHTFRPQGRFVTATDAVEVLSSTYVKRLCLDGPSFIALLFAGHFVLIRKTSQNAMSARSLTTEVDGGSIPSQAQFGDLEGRASSLQFVESFTLDEISFEEVTEGNLVRVLPAFKEAVGMNKLKHDSPNGQKQMRTFQFSGVYESKAARWTEEIVKARVESRFTEAERESGKWEVRSFKSAERDIGLFTAIFEESLVHQNTLAGPTIQLFLDIDHCSTTASASDNTAQIIVTVANAGEGFYRVEIYRPNQNKTRDLVTTAEFLPVLTKRVASLLEQRYTEHTNLNIGCLFDHHLSVLKALPLTTKKMERSPSRSRNLRPPSPVKALASLFSMGSIKDISKTKAAQTPSPLNVMPRLPPPSKINAEPTVNEKTIESVTCQGVVETSTSSQSIVSLQSLEATLKNYILALHARKGNIIGRVVANRRLASEAAINELYNILLEEPQNHERSAQAPIDVLFASFEKFLNYAWNEKMGPILSGRVLDDLQCKLEMLPPLEYEEELSRTLNELSPQNRRALASIIELLAHLLAGTSNDGDRGALTAAVTEILVIKGNANDYIPLIDRLVEDQDIIQDNFQFRHVTQEFGSTISSQTARSTTTGSISSKASSLGKRLGLGSIHKEPGRIEANGSKVGSVLRTWSKAGRPGDNSIKSALNRTRSVDLDAQLKLPSRPGSRDRNGLVNVFEAPRPSSNHSDRADPLSNVGRTNLGFTPKKKRRSSLSDLTPTPLKLATPLPVSTPVENRALSRPLPDPDFSPFTPSFLDSSSPDGQNISRTSSIRLNSASRQENTSPLRRAHYNLRDRERPGLNRLHYSNKATEISPTKVAQTTTGKHAQQPSTIPIPNGVLAERIASGNAPGPASVIEKTKSSAEVTSIVDHQVSASPTKKSRLHAASSFKDQLQGQKTAISKAEASLQLELNKIGQELSSDSGSHYGRTLSNLNTRLRALETKLPHMISTLQIHSDNIEKGALASLQASEQRTREVGQSLRMAQAENDALYQRSNQELQLVFQKVQEGQGLGELHKKLADSQDEAAKLRRENARLRRDLTTLKARAGAD